MNEGPISQRGKVETTDSLEAVGVFRGWKNIFLGIALVCLLLSQAAFWAINLGVVKTPVASETAAGPQNGGVQIVGGMNAQAARDANEAGAKSGIAGDLFTKLDFEHTARAVELINGILIIAAVLYAASVFFSLMVSLVGRLGGISHISRAFILALIALVLIIPWQMLGLSVLGVIWTAEELIQWLPTKDANVWNTAIFYLRFTGYWLAVVLLLLLSHARGTQWSKSIIRRLEII